MGRGLIILLVASLGLNIFAAGHFAGKMISGPPRGKPPMERSGGRGGFDDPFHVMRYADELSPELRAAFRGEIEQQLPVLRGEHKRMRGLKRELGALMSAEVWDGEAVTAKLNEIHAAQERQRAAFNEAFVNAFETLPAAERKMLIDTANQRRAERRRLYKKRKKGDDHRPPPPQDAPPGEDTPPSE